MTPTAHALHSQIIQSLSFRGLHRGSTQILHFCLLGICPIFLNTLEIGLILTRDNGIARNTADRKQHFVITNIFLYSNLFSSNEIRMKRDLIVAGLLVLLGLSCMLKPIQNPIIIAFWHPVGFSGLIILLAALIFMRWDISALVLLAVYVYLYSNSNLRWSEERRVESELTIDEERFNARTSVDIGFADGRLTHDGPSMLHKGSGVSPLLVYPPSESTLQSLSG